MASPTRGKTRFRIGFSLLLIVQMLLWSTAWNAPASHESHFEQLGDRSPPFLPGTGDKPSGDTPLASGENHPCIVLAFALVVAAGPRPGATQRIRTASYPVLPQAPPALT